jgi:hypothetical protein
MENPASVLRSEAGNVGTLFHVAHQCRLCGGVMHLQFDACVTMTYKLVRSVILTFELHVTHEMRQPGNILTR